MGENVKNQVRGITKKNKKCKKNLYGDVQVFLVVCAKSQGVRYVLFKMRAFATLGTMKNIRRS